MNPRTKHSIVSLYRPGYAHPAGSEVMLVEPLDSEGFVWLAELRVPDADLEGGAWYEHFDLALADLDFDVRADVTIADESRDAEPMLDFTDTLLENGSHAMPRAAR